jgi:hypothetical protein
MVERSPRDLRNPSIFSGFIPAILADYKEEIKGEKRGG